MFNNYILMDYCRNLIRSQPNPSYINKTNPIHIGMYGMLCIAWCSIGKWNANTEEFMECCNQAVIMVLLENDILGRILKYEDKAMVINRFLWAPVINSWFPFHWRVEESGSINNLINILLLHRPLYEIIERCAEHVQLQVLKVTSLDKVIRNSTKW